MKTKNIKVRIIKEKDGFIIEVGEEPEGITYDVRPNRPHRKA
jgi:hypothetical protein